MRGTISEFQRCDSGVGTGDWGLSCTLGTSADGCMLRPHAARCCQYRPVTHDLLAARLSCQVPRFDARVDETVQYQPCLTRPSCHCGGTGCPLARGDRVSAALTRPRP